MTRQTTLDRVLGLLQLGGGIYGLYGAFSISGSLSGTDMWPRIGWVGGALFYLVSAIAGGLMLGLRESGEIPSLVTQTIQVFTFVINSFVWAVSSGPRIVLGIRGYSLTFLFDVTSYFEVGPDPNAQGLLGINLLALFWAIYLIYGRVRKPAPTSGR